LEGEGISRCHYTDTGVTNMTLLTVHAVDLRGDVFLVTEAKIIKVLVRKLPFISENLTRIKFQTISYTCASLLGK
jgi:hypothetical protein